ncbi:MAG: hypothetical protein IKQ95_06055 [Synergistaceae bacterium]|nr:hypothetical protein [Synergistaceae bacterium]
MSIRKLTSILITALILFGATSAFGAEYKTKLTLTVAHASTTDEAYVLTVPADLTLSGSGWNSIGNVNVAHDSTKTTTTFDTSKKVVVTASSQNSGLTNTTDSTKKISYTFKNAETETGDGSSNLSIEFSASEINTSGGTNKSFGIVVADTSSASNGTYEDYITYTAEVQSAATTTTVTWNASDITGSGNSFTKDNVTITAGSIDFRNKTFYEGGTFTTTLGKFTKIEITAGDLEEFSGGEGWSGGTWTGTASNSVAFGRDIALISTIVFTIEQ